MKKKLAVLLTAIMVMASLSGCMLYNYGVDFNSDGSGNLSLGVYLSEEYFSSMETTPEETFTDEEYKVIDKDGLKWYGFDSSRSFASIDQLKSFYEETVNENGDVFPALFAVTKEIRDGKTYAILTASESEDMSGAAETDQTATDAELQDTKILEMNIKISAPESVKVIGLTQGVSYAKDKKSVEIILDNTMDVSTFSIECCIGKLVELPFKDVPKGIWYEKFLKTAYENGIIGGTSADAYTPDANLSHAQIIVMVANLHNLQKGGADDIFKYAVDGGHWCSAFLEYCKAEGILDNRYDDKLNAMVTRDEMAYYFAGAVSEDVYEKQQEKEFSDTAEAIYGKEIRKLAEANIVGGFSDGSYRPFTRVTRAEASVYIANIINLMNR